jgi:hypothetical protein
MVRVEYDSANAFGTPIRSSQQCLFEVAKDGILIDSPDHAARMSAVSSQFGDEHCCLLAPEPVGAEAGNKAE